MPRISHFRPGPSSDSLVADRRGPIRLARQGVEFLHDARGGQHRQPIALQHGPLELVAARVQPHLREPGPRQSELQLILRNQPRRTALRRASTITASRATATSAVQPAPMRSDRCQILRSLRSLYSSWSFPYVKVSSDERRERHASCQGCHAKLYSRGLPATQVCESAASTRHTADRPEAGQFHPMDRQLPILYITQRNYFCKIAMFPCIGPIARVALDTTLRKGAGRKMAVQQQARGLIERLSPRSLRREASDQLATIG